MTKNEYLIELAAKLQKLTDDPRKIYPELRSMIEFYQEMLEDKIEDGMTEEEAVAAMETPDEIVERLKKEFGEAAVTDYDEPEEPAANIGRAMRREYNPEKVKLVKVIDTDHRVKLIMGSQVAVNYEDDPNGRYEVTFEGGVLELKYILEKRSFFRNFFGWRRSGEAVTVELPNSWLGVADIRTTNAAISAGVAIGELIARTSNGSIVLEDTTARKISGGTSNGAIKLENVTCSDMELSTTNGRIVANDICSSRAKLTSSNASVNVQGATVSDMMLKSSNGGMRVEDLTGEKLHVQTSNASIKVEDICAQDITLITANGSVTGSINGKMGDYAITSKTSNGSNNLPNGTDGRGKLDVRTANGRIAIEFVGKIDAEE